MLLTKLIISIYFIVSFISPTDLFAAEFEDPQIAQLVELLHTGNDERKAYAASALAEKSNEKVIPHLITELDTKNNYLRAYIVDALVSYGNLALPELIQATTSEKMLTRANAADALGKIKNKKVIDIIIGLLNDKKTYVRKNAILGLSYFLEDKIMNALMDFFPKETNKKNRSAILKVLGEYKNKAVIPVLITGTKLFADEEDFFIRREAVSSISGLGLVEGAIPLIESLGDPDDEIHDIARKGLVSMGELNDKTIDLLIEALKTDNIAIKANLAIVLGELKSKKALPSLLPLLTDVGEGAADQLVILNAVNAVAKIKDNSATKPLTKLLASLNTPVRLATVEALGEIGDRSAIPALIPLVWDFHEMIRTRVITVLGDFGAKEAIDVLEKVAEKDKKERVRELAKSTIAIIKNL